jgi:hypothetical protein
MRTLSRLLAAAAIAALAAPAAAGAAQSATRGIVVQRDARGGAVVLATHGGTLQRVKLARPNALALGAVVQVTGSKISVLGHSHRVKVHGIVVRRSHGSFALAGGGSVIAVSTATPPPAGRQVTTTVRVNANALSDDDGQMQVEDSRAPSAEVRGSVLSQTGTTLLLSVYGFPSGLPIALAGQTLPVLPVGTQVEARVTLGPDPANPSGIVLTLASLRLDDRHHGNARGARVKAEGDVTAVTEAGPSGGAPGSITIADEHGDVTFVIPAGFGPSGVIVGDSVEARGTVAAPGSDPTLVRLEAGDDHGGRGGGHGGHGDGQGGSGGGEGQSGPGGDD